MRGKETAAPRARAATPTTLKHDLGKEKIGTSTDPSLIDYGKVRAELIEARLANRSRGAI